MTIQCIWLGISKKCNHRVDENSKRNTATHSWSPPSSLKHENFPLSRKRGFAIFRPDLGVSLINEIRKTHVTAVPTQCIWRGITKKCHHRVDETSKRNTLTYNSSPPSSLKRENFQMSRTSGFANCRTALL